MKDASSAGEVALEIAFTISPSHRVEFLQTADSLMSFTADAPGLGALGCFERMGAPNSFLWRERWGSSAEIEDRLEATAFKTLMGAIEVLGHLDSIEILRVTGETGERSVWT